MMMKRRESVESHTLCCILVGENQIGDHQLCRMMPGLGVGAIVCMGEESSNNSIVGGDRSRNEWPISCFCFL